MSIVEKAAQKLKARQPETQAPPAEDSTPAAPPASLSASTIERSRERINVVDEPVKSSAPPWHVDIGAFKRAGLFPVRAEAERRFADELRRVKRPLLNNTGGEGSARIAHADRIMVGSAVPGEGKSFTALNLALSLAREPDFDVLLVDADIPKADITRVLGLEDKPGLTDVLVHAGLAPGEVIVPTDVPNLSVVPAGERSQLASELFGGRRMQQVLAAWSGSGRQRLLVFDSSPLLATPEAAVLAAHMGQIVMIVAAGRTRRQELQSALEHVNASQYVGLVLNKSRLPSSESSYYGGYYGDYYSDNARGAA